MGDDGIRSGNLGVEGERGSREGTGQVFKV